MVSQEGIKVDPIKQRLYGHGQHRPKKMQYRVSWRSAISTGGSLKNLAK